MEKKYKCIVFDLDNTLWDGVILENDKIELKEEIKHMILELDRRGILMSIASKNDYSIVEDKLKEFGVWDYFLYPQITWNPKSTSIKIIKDKLNIGYDSIAFIDDQMYEREEVVFMLPEIDCFDVDILSEILQVDFFNPRFITEESASRRKMYLDDEKRSEEEKITGNIDIQFLKTQEMEFIVSIAEDKDLQRVEELVHRTNQLNATGLIYSYDELKEYIDSNNYIVYLAELKDKYGTYGKIGVCLIEKNQQFFSVKLLLMSCRVMSRGIGNLLLHHVINESLKTNRTLYCEFNHTGKNKLMYVTLKFSGFVEQDNDKRLISTNEKLIEVPEYVKLKII